MIKAYISLNNIEKLKQFVNDISKIDANIDAIHGRYVIDAKSFLGLMSLDLERPVEIVLHSEDEETINKFKELMVKYGD